MHNNKKRTNICIPCFLCMDSNNDKHNLNRITVLLNIAGKTAEVGKLTPKSCNVAVALILCVVGSPGGENGSWEMRRNKTDGRRRRKTLCKWSLHCPFFGRPLGEEEEEGGKKKEEVDCPFWSLAMLTARPSYQYHPTTERLFSRKSRPQEKNRSTTPYVRGGIFMLPPKYSAWYLTFSFITWKCVC